MYFSRKTGFEPALFDVTGRHFNQIKLHSQKFLFYVELNTPRFELGTRGLKVQCSAAELRILFDALLPFFYRAKRNKKTIISAKRAIASVKANPKIAILKSSSFKDGFLEIPITKAPNTVPIPTPAPAKPIVASPAPIYFAACNSIKFI